MKNVLVEQKKIKLQNKLHFLENKLRDYKECLKKAINFLIA